MTQEEMLLEAAQTGSGWKLPLMFGFIRFLFDFNLNLLILILQKLWT